MNKNNVSNEWNEISLHFFLNNIYYNEKETR